MYMRVCVCVQYIYITVPAIYRGAKHFYNCIKQSRLSFGLQPSAGGAVRNPPSPPISHNPNRSLLDTNTK